jgi:hypothetical protein
MFNTTYNFFGHVTVGGEVKQNKVFTLAESDFNYISKIIPQPYFSTSEINPIKLV